MSGEETLAQVNREIAHPKLKNLEKTGLVIFVYSLLFTSLVSFFAVMIIPDNVRPDLFRKSDRRNLHVFLVGPEWARLCLPWLCRAGRRADSGGAQNTSIVGANGVLNRVAEDGVLTVGISEAPPALRHQLPHHQHDRGLAAADDHPAAGAMSLPLAGLYAFGVIWSFAMMSLAVLVLRYKEPGGRQWKVPGNLHIGKTRITVWAWLWSRPCCSPPPW